MAIDKERTQQLLAQINELFNSSLAGAIPQAVVDLIKNKVMGPALGDLQRLVDEARAPVFYMIGQSGHGKSSLINALAGQDVAPVGPGPDPCTLAASKYEIRFPERHAEWIAYDSRGIFDRDDAKKPPRQDAVAAAINDILACTPDIIFHVLLARQVRAMAKDVEVMRNVQEAIVAHKGTATPMISILTHVDGIGDDVTEWPPEQFPEKQSLIADFVSAMAEHGASAGHEYKPIESMPLFRGCQIEHGNSPYLYVIPVNVPRKVKQRWNLETLITVISGQLPAAARLLFFQALHRKEMLRRISSDLITRFATIAAGIGATPIPISDLFLLAPLQMLMIAAIGGLSCREPTVETAKEYAVASGGVWAAGTVLREGFRQFLKLLPLWGVSNVIAGGLAAAGTYSIGKSAEAYFFAGEVRKPEEFKKEGEQFATDHKLDKA